MRDVEDHEVFPNAPLRFVVAEVRYNRVPPLATPQAMASVYRALVARFPIEGSVPDDHHLVATAHQPPAKEAIELRMLNSERTWSVAISPTRLAIHTTAYTHLPELLEVADLALESISDYGVSVIKRIGLRYVDEVRVDGVNRPSDWAPYIAAPLVAPADFCKADLKSFYGEIVMDQGHGRTLHLEYGTRNGFAVDPNGELRGQASDEGHFFVLDWDSYTESAGEDLWEFSPDVVMDEFIALHEPVHATFMRSVTERLVDEVLR